MANTSKNDKDIYCPNCGGLDIEWTSAYSAEGNVLEVILCHTCRVRWIDHWYNDDNIQN